MMNLGVTYFSYDEFTYTGNELVTKPFIKRARKLLQRGASLTYEPLKHHHPPLIRYLVLIFQPFLSSLNCLLGATYLAVSYTVTQIRHNTLFVLVFLDKAALAPSHS